MTSGVPKYVTMFLFSHCLSAMTTMLSLIPAVYCSVCFDDLVIVRESKLANIEALKSNGKQLASMSMMDDVWELSVSKLFVWDPGDSWSVIT